jgi:ribonuclease BN (tRNA processing enzyme)
MHRCFKPFIGGIDAVWLQVSIFQKGLYMRTLHLPALFMWAILILSACSEPESGPIPGSAEPHLAPGPDGSVIMSWLEAQGEATALRYSLLSGGEWSKPRTIASGDNWFVNWADFPSVVAIDDDLWAAHWLVKAADGTYEYDVAVSISADGGKTWQEPITPHTDGTLSEHGFVSLYPARGGVGALWLDGRSMETGMTLRSAVVTKDSQVTEGQLADDLVCDCCQTDVAMGPDGPIAVYRNRTADEIRDIYVMRMVDGKWEQGRPVADDGWNIAGCPVNGPAIAARGDHVAVTWFTAANNETKVRLAMSTNGAESFGDAIDIAVDRPLGRVGILLLDNGTAIVSWLSQGEGSEGLIQARAVFADGTLGEATTVATTSSGRMSGFPQIAEHGDGIVFAWTQTGGDASRVETLIYDKSALVQRPAEVVQQCPPTIGIALQVLGSGGPVADDARASTAYLVWIDGKSRLMIDAGGGSFLRFGEAQARFTDLDFVGLSHFHTDHSADFPALLKSGYFTNRERELVVAGPGGNSRFPGLRTYLDSMLNPDDGAYAYLGGYLDGSGGLVKIEAVEVDASDPITVYEHGDITVDALHVPHGIVPALAFRVTIEEESLVFSSDQSLGNPAFETFAAHASTLVMHMPLPEAATSGTTLHAVPSRIGEFAGAAQPGMLVLSHFMARSLRDFDTNVDLVRAGYDGDIIVAEDLACYSLNGN